MFPGPRQVICANSLVGFFGTLAKSNASTVKFGANIDVPSAVIHGTNDEITLPPNAEVIHRSLTRAPVRVGAGHCLTPPGKIAEDYAATIAAWLPKVMLALKR
jgi:pimeloyl-ACP methyl ester carboxylesterase